MNIYTKYKKSFNLWRSVSLFYSVFFCKTIVNMPKKRISVPKEKTIIEELRQNMPLE